MFVLRFKCFKRTTFFDVVSLQTVLSHVRWLLANHYRSLLQRECFGGRTTGLEPNSILGRVRCLSMVRLNVVRTSLAPAPSHRVLFMRGGRCQTRYVPGVIGGRNSNRHCTTICYRGQSRSRSIFDFDRWLSSTPLTWFRLFSRLRRWWLSSPLKVN